MLHGRLLSIYKTQTKRWTILQYNRNLICDTFLQIKRYIYYNRILNGDLRGPLSGVFYHRHTKTDEVFLEEVVTLLHCRIHGGFHKKIILTPTFQIPDTLTW